eukprot:721614_1
MNTLSSFSILYTLATAFATSNSSSQDGSTFILNNVSHDAAPYLKEHSATCITHNVHYTLSFESFLKTCDGPLTSPTYNQTTTPTKQPYASPSTNASAPSDSTHNVFTTESNLIRFESISNLNDLLTLQDTTKHMATDNNINPNALLVMALSSSAKSSDLLCFRCNVKRSAELKFLAYFINGENVNGNDFATNARHIDRHHTQNRSVVHAAEYVIDAMMNNDCHTVPLIEVLRKDDGASKIASESRISYAPHYDVHSSSFPESDVDPPKAPPHALNTNNIGDRPGQMGDNLTTVDLGIGFYPIHSTAFNEATNAFNTTSSSPHALNLPIVQSSSVSQLISPSVLVTHGHNEGRHTFANNNIPGQQTEARMTGIQSIDEELTHTSTAR